MFNFVFALAAVVLVVAIVAIPMSFCEWAAENNRVPFFVKWYKDWNRKEGKRRVAAAKKAY